MRLPNQVMPDRGMDSIVDDIMRDEKENAAGTDDLTHLAHPGPHAQGKLCAVVEFKGLRVLDKQWQMRALVAERLTRGLSFHTEKEEQKRIECISRERLKALKADDEEAYMKLIDTAKDTRIARLLDQTDAYLDSLTQAVMEQQRDGSIQDGGEHVAVRS